LQKIIDWTSYTPGKYKFRLERVNVSFAYPPSPLESGVRFHGKNYFNFSTSKYFAEGYPFFGLEMLFQTRLNNSLIYYAGKVFLFLKNEENLFNFFLMI